MIRALNVTECWLIPEQLDVLEALYKTYDMNVHDGTFNNYSLILFSYLILTLAFFIVYHTFKALLRTGLIFL